MMAETAHMATPRGATPRLRRASDPSTLKRVCLKPISRGNGRSSARCAAQQGRVSDEGAQNVTSMKMIWRLARLEYQTLKREGDGHVGGPASLPCAADAIVAAVGTLRRRRSKFANLVECSSLHETTEKKLTQRIRSRLEASVPARELDLVMEGILQSWKELQILQCKSFVKACAVLTAALFSEWVLVGQAGEWRANLRSKLNKLVVLQDDDGGIVDRAEMLTGIVDRAETVKSLLDRTSRSFINGSFRWARNYHRDLQATHRVCVIQEAEAREAALAATKATVSAEARQARRSSWADIFARQSQQEDKLAHKMRRRSEIAGASAGHRQDVPLLDTLPDLSNMFPCSLEGQPVHDSYRGKYMYCGQTLTANPRELAVPLKPPSAGREGRQAQRPSSAIAARGHVKVNPIKFAAVDPGPKETDEFWIHKEDQLACSVPKQLPEYVAQLGAQERFEGG